MLLSNLITLVNHPAARPQGVGYYQKYGISLIIFSIFFVALHFQLLFRGFDEFSEVAVFPPFFEFV